MRGVAALAVWCVLLGGSLGVAQAQAQEGEEATPVATPTATPAAAPNPTPTPVPKAEPTPAATPTSEPQPQGEGALDVSGLQALSLEELLQVELGVAARTARTIRESPGVVTLITRDDILASGARDLADVMLRVPGVGFGIDVSGVMGIGFRGLWGHEGKVLLLVDGQEMNENLYSTTQWGQHIPVDQLERIEIVRGPGSAIYGGYAELAVINVVTRRGSDLEGGDVNLVYGQTAKDYARRGATFGYGRKLANGIEFSLAGSFSEGRRSDRRFEDFYGDSFSMRRSSDLEASFASIGASWKGFSLRYLFDDYLVRTRDGYDTNYPRAYRQSFASHHAEARWDGRFGSWTVTPKLNYRRQTPWHTAAKSNDAPFYDKSVERFTGGIAGSWDAMPGVNVLVGAEAYQDHAFLNDHDLVGFQGEFDGEPSVTYQNVAGYSQALWDNPIASVAVGARFENHSQFGSSFVPRAAVTKVIDRFHAKLLFSNAFRAPGVENLALNPDIEPERTTVFEAEAGYRLGSGIFVTANVFDITMQDPIVYYYDLATDAEGYLNFERTGSRGAELEVRYFQAKRYASLGVSFYDAAGKNEVALYEVPGSRSELLGFPQAKVVGVAGMPVMDKVGIEASAILLGPRWGYLEGDGAGNTAVEDTPPVVLIDLYVRAEDVGMKGLDLGIGLYNAADADYRVIQPYAGGHAPMPTNSRELFARMTYAF